MVYINRNYISRNWKLFIVFTSAILILLTTASCRRTDYTIQAFTFPAGSKAHNNDWRYMAKVIVTSNHTPISDKSNKHVEVIILDSAENILFKRNFKFDCASIRATAEWEKFDFIDLKLNEVGNSFAKDDYNKKLIDNGMVMLVHMSLQYDYSRKVFYVKGLNP